MFRITRLGHTVTMALLKWLIGWDEMQASIHQALTNWHNAMDGVHDVFGDD